MIIANEKALQKEKVLDTALTIALVLCGILSGVLLAGIYFIFQDLEILVLLLGGGAK